MPASERLSVDGFDEVHRVDLGGTVAYLALHAVVGGHAFGGIRIRSYPDEAAALDDALALAGAMSRKVVLAGLIAGGGKTVVIEPGPGVDRAACLRRLGAFIESLEGRYCCGPDLGFTDADDAALRETTDHVACSGMSAFTARSVLDAMHALVERPRVVAVQGLGAVGLPLAEALRAEGAEVVASDVRPVAGQATIEPDALYDVEADVFAPCAVGGVLDAGTIPRLRCRLVCGGANNPFATPADVDALHARDIAYVPDVLSNCGAAIVGVSTALGQAAAIPARLAEVGPRVSLVAERAAAEGRSMHHVALALADELLDELRRDVRR